MPMRRSTSKACQHSTVLRGVGGLWLPGEKGEMSLAQRHLPLILIFNKTIESFYCAAFCGTSDKAAENVVHTIL